MQMQLKRFQMVYRVIIELRRSTVCLVYFPEIKKLLDELTKYEAEAVADQFAFGSLRADNTKFDGDDNG